MQKAIQEILGELRIGTLKHSPEVGLPLPPSFPFILSLHFSLPFILLLFLLISKLLYEGT